MNEGAPENANGGGATDLTTPGSEQSRWQPRKYKVRGKEVVVDSPEKLDEYAQKGLAFEERNLALKREREEFERERSEIQREKARLKRLADVDDLLASDPERRAKVNAILNGGQGSDDELSDDPVLRELEIRDRRSQAQIAALTDQVNRLSQGVTQGIGTIRRDRTLDSEERILKRQYPKLATEERIDEARQLAEKRGLSLEEAFRISSFDEMPELIRGEVITELGVDPTKIGPQRGEDFVVDGFGPMDEEKLNDLFERDPDAYARLRPQLKAWRLRRSGKQELPR